MLISLAVARHDENISCLQLLNSFKLDMFCDKQSRISGYLVTSYFVLKVFLNETRT